MRAMLVKTEKKVDPNTLHKKWTFPLRFSSVNVTNLVAFTEGILNEKLHFFVQWQGERRDREWRRIAYSIFSIVCTILFSLEKNR